MGLGSGAGAGAGSSRLEWRRFELRVLILALL